MRIKATSATSVSDDMPLAGILLRRLIGAIAGCLFRARVPGKPSQQVRNVSVCRHKKSYMSNRLLFLLEGCVT